jgi:hypothetical protein
MILKTNTTAWAVCRIDEKGREVIDSNILPTRKEARDWEKEILSGWINSPEECAKWQNSKLVKIQISKV